MAWEYARKQILEALKSTNGNAVAAGRLVMDATAYDNRLLVELSAPHLKGIVAHAVSRVIHEQSNPPEETPDEAESLNMPLDQFGKDLLGALGGRNTPRFGFEDTAPHPGHKGASKAHIDTIMRIAKKTTDK